MGVVSSTRTSKRRTMSASKVRRSSTEGRAESKRPVGCNSSAQNDRADRGVELQRSDKDDVMTEQPVASTSTNGHPSSLSHPRPSPSHQLNPFAALIPNQNVAVVDVYHLEGSRRELREVEIAYSTWGKLNEAADNAMVICHALTGSSDVEDWCVRLSWVHQLALHPHARTWLWRPELTRSLTGGVLSSAQTVHSTHHATSSSAPMSSARPTVLPRRSLAIQRPALAMDQSFR